ncbi:restriction endonuclease subunit S [Flavobacterium sp. RNTU_13]|uniref:restriction endonuclease subunit S n=1 Tax=Flavobacterium sp. RNTU_13 TaxID=3375145 RepID=UPI003985D494
MAQHTTPKLRFPEFSGAWEEKKLGDVSNFLDGRRRPIKQSDRNNIKGIYPYYGASGIIDYVNDFIFDEEIILLGEDGENILSRNLPLAFKVTGKCWINNHAHVIKPNTKANIDFLTQVLERIDYTKYNTGTAQPKLNQDVCKNIFFKLPTLPEQQKIASFLSAADKKLEQLQQKKTLLEQYKKGMMQKLFSQQIRFKDDGGKDFPEWEEKELGEVGKVVNGLTYSPENINENGILVLRSSNIKDRTLTFTDNVYVSVESGKYNPIVENDILICVRNGSKNLIGKNAIINKENEGLAFGAFMTVYRSDFNKYIFHYFDTDNYRKEIDKNLGATINSINGSELKRFKIPFPSLAEQTKIAEFLTAIDAKIAAVSAQVAAAKGFKKGLLQQMFV